MLSTSWFSMAAMVRCVCVSSVCSTCSRSSSCYIVRTRLGSMKLSLIGNDRHLLQDKKLLITGGQRSGAATKRVADDIGHTVHTED